MDIKINRFFLFLLITICITVQTAFSEDTQATEPPVLSFLEAGSEPIITDTTYVSDNVIITITSERRESSDVYIADIRLKDVSSFRRVFCTGDWKRSGTQKKVAVMAEETNAILAMTGDNSYNFDAGIVIGNGKVYRTSSNKKRDLCVLYLNGEMKTFIAGTVDPKELAQQVSQDAEDGLVWQTFLFGPALLDAEGHAMSSFNTNVGVANPRSVIGYYEPGHYVFIQVDGRGTKSVLESGRTSRGLKMTQLSQLAEELGLKCAYNLDGGQSSMLWFNGRLVSTPYKNGRRVADIVAICSGLSEE